MFKSKKGVSLITVLLFMLVATIAATATFKWLTSENRSSATRMLRQEAYKSSIAGIENTRAWMSSHANEVGAIIKQYFDNDKKPVLLNSVLPQLSRNSQTYNVWLTAVNTESNTYKLKLLSEGNSRNGTTHTEAAIVNVDGLYRVKIPTSTQKFTFNKAFHGASTGITATDTIGSGNINGDWEYSNNPVVNGDMIVTGSTKYGGTVHHYGDFYLAGNLQSDGESFYGTPGLDTTVVYIGGNVSCPDGQHITVYGDLYAKGDISSKCRIVVKGNFTVGGHVVRYQKWGSEYSNKYDIEVGKNWVFTNKNADHKEQLDLQRPVDATSNITLFSVGKNLYMPYKIKAYCNTGDGNCGDYYEKRVFNVGGNVYRYNNDQFEIETQQDRGYNYGVYMDGYTRPFNNKERCVNDDTKNCKKARIFSFNAHSVSNDRIQEWKESDDVLKDIGDKYWANINKLNKYGKMISPKNNQVPDPIKLKNEAAWKSAKANAHCGIFGAFNMDDYMVDKLNSCYSTAKSNGWLYNDEYLIIEWDNDQQRQSTHDLVGKFVFYVTTPLSQVYLPSTAKGSYVFLYLEQGASAELFGKASKEYNYVIYSKGDIAQINGLHIRGSVILSEGKSLKKYQGGVNLEYDEKILKSLANAGIIRENPAYTALITGEEVDEEGNIVEAAAQDDIYYIATSPHLGITLESQYETRETVAQGADDTQAITPSAVILPRVIYLTRNPNGKLIDYYNVINLNGANEQKDASKITCDPALNTNGLLYQNAKMLDDDVYTCKHQSSQYGDLIFYVVVDGETGVTPAIKMQDSVVEISAGGPITTISAEVEQTSHPSDVSIDISVIGHPDGWDIQPVTGTNLTLRTKNSYEAVYTLTFKPNVSTIDLFTVSTSPAAKKGSVYFYLTSPMVGCTIKPPSSTRVLISGYISVTRGDISQYCSKSENIGICSENGYDQKINNLSCEDLVSGEWIKATGTNATVVDANNKWEVGTNSAISLVSTSNVPSYCELILPTANNSIVQATQNSEYTLYASLKRKRYTLTVKTKDNDNSNTGVSVYYGDTQDSYTDITSSLCEKNSEGNLVCSVYAGWYVKTAYTEAGDDKFSRWECSGENCVDNKPKTTAEYTLSPITGDNIITAVFNDKDHHCFYEDFTNLTAFCERDQTNCINNCENANTSCSVSGVVADWQLMYANNGNSSSLPPTIQNGYITSNNSIPSGNSTIILSTKEAGIHGTMTTLIQTTLLENSNKSLNSGFIFSSDAAASSFTLVNIYGDESNDNALTARVCKGSQSLSSTKNENCTNQVLKDANDNKVAITSVDMIKLKMDLTIENKLKITATVNGTTTSTELDISSYLGSREEHSHYVGFDISDPSFKIYDIGWSSLYFEDKCFENPKVSCSFAANYLGGLVPKDENVTPWVGISSWFEDHDCSVSYYYNGCDNTTGNSSFGCDGYKFNWNWYASWREEYDVDGNYFGANLSDGTYHFTEGGEHGTTQTFTYYGNKTITRAVNDAKVKVTCNNQSSLNGTWASCGSFWVGDITHCSKNAEILSSSETSIYGNAGSELIIPVDNNNDETIVNLRDATLWIDISGFTENGEDKIIVHLKDANGNLSIPREITTNGRQSFNVDVMSSLDSFDPQTIKAVILQSTYYSYQVNSIMSSCPYALGINNCRAKYNGISWTISSTITHVEGAAANGCSVKPKNSTSYILENVSCPENGEFKFTEENLYEQVNYSDIDEVRSYVITAKNRDGGEVSCTTDPDTLTAVQVACNVAQTQIVKGATMPALNYNFTGCPYDKCYYTVSVDNPAGGKKSESGSGTGSSSTWSPNLIATNTGSFDYYLTILGKEHNCGTVNVQNASPATVTNCDYTTEGINDENYKLTATVSPANDGSEWNMQISIVDNIGQVYKTEPHEARKGTGTKFEQAIPTAGMTPGTYTAMLYLNGEVVATSGCTKQITIEGPSSSSTVISSSSAASSSSAQSSSSSFTLTCPDNKTNQDPDQSITLQNFSASPCGNGCTYKVFDGSTEKDFSANSFYDPNGTGTKTYSFVASNSYGKKDTCEFTVAFKSANSNCECTCGDCSNVETTAYGTNEYTAFKHCIFIDNGNAKFRIDHKCSSIKINGIEISGTHNETEIKNYVSTTKDGGYYLEIIHNGSSDNNREYCNYQINHTSSTNPCGSSGGSGGSEEIDEPSGDCHAPTGCKTPITSGTFAWDGKCYFFTSLNWLNNNNAGIYSINGIDFNGYVNEWTQGFPNKIDGGYYVKTNTSSCCGKDGTLGKPTCN